MHVSYTVAQFSIADWEFIGPQGHIALASYVYGNVVPGFGLVGVLQEGEIRQKLPFSAKKSRTYF